MTFVGAVLKAVSVGAKTVYGPPDLRSLSSDVTTRAVMNSPKFPSRTRMSMTLPREPVGWRICEAQQGLVSTENWFEDDCGYSMQVMHS